MGRIGIDLGTTNSVVAVWREDKARVVKNVLGQTLTPSVVGVDDNGEILVGQPAKERLITHPRLTAAAFKRHMGSNDSIELGRRAFRPEELSSLVLRSLKADAEAYLGEPVSEAVISVPAYFNDAQRKATRAAGELAGLVVERLINEPTAAAIAYGLHLQHNRTFLVFDLGGGTFDVSVLELFEGVMEVHASAGDNFLGGDDFSRALAKAFASDLQLDLDELSLSERSLLKKQSEICKRKLSSSESAANHVRMKGRDVSWEISRDRFEAITSDLIQRIRRPIERAIQDAKLRAADLDAVILVGGATRMPQIRGLIARMFGRFPLSTVDPDETVAIGAAIQAGLKAREKALSEVVLTDICPYSLGVDVARCNASGQIVGTEFQPIIERNTTVPASHEAHFVTAQDDQTRVQFNIYQGESRSVEKNIRLGTVRLRVPKGKAGEQQMVVRFTYDINGLLEVDALVASTGLCKTVVIEENPGLLTKEQIRERLAKLQALKIHPREQLENRTFLARAERVFEESLGETREQVRQILARFEDALERRDPREIDVVRKELSEVLDAIEGGQTIW